MIVYRSLCSAKLKTVGKRNLDDNHCSVFSHSDSWYQQQCLLDFSESNPRWDPQLFSHKQQQDDYLVSYRSPHMRCYLSLSANHLSPDCQLQHLQGSKLGLKVRIVIWNSFVKKTVIDWDRLINEVNIGSNVRQERMLMVRCIKFFLGK